jgi:alcohol dehydrogenase, propanol-preferring
VQPLEKINEVFDKMLKGEINGRVVLTLEDKSNRAPFSRGNNQ